jgi:cephalosporin hydroxylase
MHWNRHMEESLDLPLSEVLQIIQDRILNETTYFGVKALKNPSDFWVYQEILFEAKPDVIIEIGNNHGGSTLAWAHLCDLLGKGRVIGLDISQTKIPDVVRKHPRITLIEGDACESFAQVQQRIRPDESVLVLEDSAHTYENTLNVLHTYSPLIKPGGHFIVEDSICHHGLNTGPDPGPYEAIETFVQDNPEFEIDRSRESCLVTWNPKGFLRRRGEGGGTRAAVAHRAASRTSFANVAKLFVPPILTLLARKLSSRPKSTNNR